MAVNDMLKKRQNGISKRNKMMRGGGASDAAYSISSYILLFISYIFFGFATILLINARFNYNKVDIADKDDADITPLIEEPIFEYLKRNNFMAIEEYLLVYNKPIFLIFIGIIGVCVIIIMVSHKNFDIFNTTFLIALAIYMMMLGIFISFNVINSYKPYLPTDLLAKYYITDIIKDSKLEKGTPEYLNFYKDLKYIITDALNTKTDEKEAIIYIKDKISKSSNQNVKLIDVEKDFLFYKYIVEYYYYYKTPKEQNEYINYINNYFDLVSNDIEPKKNEYINYYIYGLIKSGKNPKGTIDRKEVLKKYLNNFKKNIKIYYILVFVFYGLFFIAAFIILGIDKPSMNFITIYWLDIGKVIIGIILIYIPIWLTMLL
jgi:hypothetical protein